MIKWPKEFINVDLSEIIAEGAFSEERFKKYGVQLLPGFLNEEECSGMRNVILNSRVREFHPVARDLDEKDQILAVGNSVRSKIAKTFGCLLGENIGLTAARFLSKNPGEEGRVVLHQDVGYHLGSFDQVSLFCALGDIKSENGGLRFVLGSHHLGYLGDAGSLEKFHPDAAEVCPELKAGDCIIMHCATIHCSGINHSERTRDIFEILLCPSTQPWRIDDISSGRRSDSVFSRINPKGITLFKSGRSQRLAAIRGILDLR